MNKVLSTILDEQKVLDLDGTEHLLHSSIDRREVEFLLSLISRYKITNTLEVGCAMGVSSLAICEGISKNSHESIHTIIDPYQTTDWKSVGIYNLKRAGFQNFRILEKPSEFILPKLAQEEFKIDMAFIDGWHTFDHTLVDFFYINRMLKPGGIVVVDDVCMPSVKKVMRMIHTYPSYRYIGGVKVEYSSKTKVLETTKDVLRPLIKLFGNSLSQEFVNASLLKSDRFLGLNASVVAFQKVAEDRRQWNWFQNF